MAKGTVLITGGAKRIGLAIAKSLAEDGYTIALHYNTSEVANQEAINILKSIQPESRSYQCDLTDLSAVEQLIKDVYQNHSDLSVLINNASVFEKQPILNTDKLTIERDIKVHYIAPFILIREFAKCVKEGTIINMLDAGLKKNSTGNASYAISKKALATLTELAALELAPSIRVNAIAPGAILPPPGKPQVYLEKLVEKIPLNRSGSISDITNGVTTLLKGSYLTGQTLYIDGGMYL
jgi:pteridine reductase